MRWNRGPKVERPEYPKLIAVDLAGAQAHDLLSLLLPSDPEAQIVQGGAHGLFARVHNAASEAAVRSFVDRRNWPEPSRPT